MDNQLMIRNLDSTVSPADLESLFESVGDVKSAKVEKIEAASGHRYIGYVQLASAQQADDCIDRFNGQMRNGLVMVVCKAGPHIPDPNYKFDKKLNASPKKNGYTI